MEYYKLVKEDGFAPCILSRIYKGDFNNKNLDCWSLSVEFYANKFPEYWELSSEEEYLKQEDGLKESETTNVKPYYKGRNSLYQFAEEHELNSYEFDTIKRVTRCRHKGNWLEDLEKTKEVIDIYIKECKERYNG